MTKYLSVTLQAGAPAILDGTGAPVLTAIQAGITYKGSTWNRLQTWNAGPWEQVGTEAAGVLRCDNVTIEYHRLESGMALRTVYTHRGETLPSVERFYTLRGLWRCGIDRCLYNGPGYANVYVNEMQSHVHTARLTDGARVYGTEHMAFIDTAGGHCVAGYMGFEEYFTCMEAGSEGRLGAYGQLEGRSVATGDVLTGDWFLLLPVDDVRCGLMDYARLAADHMGSRGGIAETPYGYCTWYYYGGGLQPRVVTENLAVLTANRHRIGVKYFNLDDGWYRKWGEWEENDKFACGMKKIADEIREAGYLPGIWLAPFGVVRDSALAKAHPDWLVQKRDADEPVVDGNGWMALDMSHPAVKEYVVTLFEKVSKQWGYRHVKIDIIAPTLMAGRYFDPSFNMMKNYREGLRLIRSGLTEDTVLLACTAPLGGAIGYADSCRTSEDIFEDWDCLLSVFNQNLKRYYMNKVWFNNDPDCLLVRKAENEDGECIRQCVRTDEEIRTFATALTATGGAVILSDKLPLLSEWQLELLSKMYPINTQSAVPLDLMDSEVPGILDLGRRERTHIFALINWTDADKAFLLDTGDGHVFSFWDQRYLGHRRGGQHFDLSPHQAMVLFVTDPLPSSVIGTDACLCPTLVQHCGDAGGLSGRFLKPGETLTLVLSAPLVPPDSCRLTPRPDGTWALTHLAGPLDFCLLPAQGECVQ